MTHDEKKLRERTWALSVFLGKIDDGELKRIAESLSFEDNTRLAAVVESYREDLAIRDLIGPIIVDE